VFWWILRDLITSVSPLASKKPSNAILSPVDENRSPSSISPA
jgi:hypothetical protein